jgi:hypothetical protein
MVLLIYGMLCELCGKPQERGQKLIGFQHFVPNELDPIFFFSDDSFHKECFDQHPLAEKVVARYKEFKERLADHTCPVCSEQITHPDDAFFLTHFTEDETHPIHRYNYLQFHRSCLSKWSELSLLISLLEVGSLGTTWKAGSLQSLLNGCKQSLKEADEGDHLHG